MKRKFVKMQGCGNDYVYFDCMKETFENPEAQSIRLADRHFGIGGDGIILICPSTEADAKMRMFNADGSEGRMCGNGIRCVSKYLYDEKLVGETFTIETLSGIKFIQMDETGERVRVDMGSPIIEAKEVPVITTQEEMIDAICEVDGISYPVTCVSMGNPHCIMFVEDVESIKIEEIGPKFENHPMFPEKTNVEFIKVIDDHTLQMRVWERGSGETLACGTGACASAVAAVLVGHCAKDQPITVQLRGGDLEILYTENKVYMTGDAKRVFEGEVEL